MMEKNEQLIEPAAAVKTLFEERRGQFQAEDFGAVADLLGFHAYAKAGGETRATLAAESHLPDIIQTNLRHALEAYEWKTHIPVTEDGVIVSDFWDHTKGTALPEGYELKEEGRFLGRTG
jgi:hypothetical protein